MSTHPPGPPPIRAPWSLYRYVKRFAVDPLGFVGGRFETYGDLYYAPLGRLHLYATRDAGHVQDALVNKARSFEKPQKGRAAATLRHALGMNLLNNNGEAWRRSRRMIQPSLNRSRLASYAEVMVEHAEARAERLHDGQALDMSPELTELTLGIVAKLLFDVDVAGDYARVRGALAEFLGLFGSPSLLPAWVPTAQHRRARRARADLDGLIYGWIDERIALPAEELAQRDDLLSALVQAVDEEGGDGARLSREQLRNETLTLFFAGHDTTSHALAWTLFCLAQHPDADARLAEEVSGVLGGRSPTPADLEEMPFLSQVFDEALRLYPPAPTFSRVTTEEVEIGGYRLERGAELLFWIYWLHRNPAYWSEPERFDPDRFAKDAPRPPAGAYAPFGGGARLCIGKHFALLEARLILAVLCQRFRFELAPGADVRPRPRVTLSPSELPMVVRAR